MITKNDRSLTEAQQRRITDAEEELKDNLDAHEKMRELLEPAEWRQAGPPSQGRTMAGEIPKLQRDIKDCVIKVLRVLAEASWSLGSVKLFGDQLQNDACDLLEWALAKVNPNDLLALDKREVETALAHEVSTWIRKAQREFPPPWKVTTFVQPTDSRSLDREGNLFSREPVIPAQVEVAPKVDTGVPPKGVRVFPARAESDEPMPQVMPLPAKEGERCFRKTGEVWFLLFDGKQVSIQHRLGMTYIEHLLRSPDRSLGCEALQAAAGGNPKLDKLMDNEERVDIALAGSVRYEILDETARKQYKDRLDSIEAEMHQAERNNDPARHERLEDEKQTLIEQINAATGLGGRSRTFTTESEKARKAVARAIGTALTKIGEHHPELAKHLDNRIERGGECCYKSDGIAWEV